MNYCRSDDEAAIERRPQIRIVSRVTVGEHDRASRNRKDMFEKPTAKWKELIKRCGHELQFVTMLIQKEQHEPAQRLMVHVAGDQVSQLLEHLLRIEAGMLDQVGGVKAVVAIPVEHRTNILDIDLCSEFGMFLVYSADFVGAA